MNESDPHPLRRDCPQNISDYFDIRPMPDISGIGVLVGFTTPAFLLLLIVCIYYIFTYDPSLDPHRNYNENKKSPRPNPFDQIVLGIIRRLLGINPPELRDHHIYRGLQGAFNKCVLSMADTQVITGMAILIGSYLSRSELSAFHWKMIVYLAWFSCSTHLSTLVFLRNYLLNHPAERWWRVLSMLTLLLFLTIAMIPTGHFYWDVLAYELFFDPKLSVDDGFICYFIDATPAENATTYFNSNFTIKPTYGKDPMIISIALLVIGFSTRILKLHRRILGFRVESITRQIIDKILQSASFFQRLFGTSSLEDRVVSNIMVSAHMTLCVWIDLLSSMASDVYWLIISLIWGTIKIVNLRFLLSQTKDQGELWSFGQVLPVLLLALPCISLIELFLRSLFSGKNEMTHTTSHNSIQTSVERDPISIRPRRSIDNSERTNTSSRDISRWIIRPELLDAYYKDSVWMRSVLILCSAHIVQMTISLLVSIIMFKNSNGISIFIGIPIDTVVSAKFLIVWFIFSQGATIQLAILLLSLVETKLKNRTAVRCTIIFITACLQCGSSWIGLLAWLTGDRGTFVYLVPLSYVMFTLLLFLVSLVVRQLSVLMRTWKEKSHLMD